MTTDLEDYSLARVIKGIYGSEYKTIALDIDGNIIGVFKGDYAGDLQTIALDAYGRIKAVLTDPEDVFGNPAYMGAAELAARLGSINTFERRGTTLWMDDFENGINKWLTDVITGTRAFEASTAHCYTGSNSFKITCNEHDTDTTDIYAYLPAHISGKVGIELAFTAGADIESLTFGFRRYTGTVRDISLIKMNFAANKIQYLNSGNTFTDLATSIDFAALDYLFHKAKLVVDLSTNEYVRLIFNDTSYSLADIATYGTAEGTVKHTRLWIYIDNNTNDPNYTYIDDVIFTQNEP